MTIKITQDLLTKYIYNETSAYENELIEEALNVDYQLREEYNDLLEAKKNLPKVEFSPAALVIDKILNYSKSTHLEAC